MRWVNIRETWYNLTRPARLPTPWGAEIMNDENKAAQLLSSGLTVINVGLESFARDLEDRGVAVLHLDWSPPAGGNAKLADLLSRLGA